MDFTLTFTLTVNGGLSIAHGDLLTQHVEGKWLQCPCAFQLVAISVKPQCEPAWAKSTSLLLLEL